MVGPLAHLLKNRFYVGEVVYKGEVHKGEHEPILDRDLFEAVQEKLAEQAVARKLSRSPSPSMLTGLIFDDRGNPMSPSHANKKGVRYRYYVSHALLQNRKADSGSIARVSAPDVEALVCEAVKQKSRRIRRSRIASSSQRHVERVTVRPKELEIKVRSDEDGAEAGAPTSLSIPFVPNLPRQKGIAHAPADQGNIDAEARDALLRAIARARGWLDAILSGKAASFDDIAAAENLAERHVRFLCRWRSCPRASSAPLPMARPRLASPYPALPAPCRINGSTRSECSGWARATIRSRNFIFRQIAARGSPPHRSDGPGYRPERPRRMPADCEIEPVSSRNRTGLRSPLRKFRRLEIGAQRLGPK